VFDVISPLFAWRNPLIVASLTDIIMDMVPTRTPVVSAILLLPFAALLI
jgi:hypothetical protein